MAHRSRLGCIVIDCQTDDLEPATRFWSEVLGCTGTVDADGKYAVLKGDDGDPKLLLQTVDHESRVHLDIETDDKDAEVSRLEAVGARKIAAVKNWVVMEAPTGHRFCVVDQNRPDLAERGNLWSDV